MYFLVQTTKPVGFGHGLQGYAPLDDEQVGLSLLLVSPEFRKSGQDLEPHGERQSQIEEQQRKI